jgi:hypothetical protein
MTDLHGRLVEEIKWQIHACDEALNAHGKHCHCVICVGLSAHHGELSAALRIAELHAPHRNMCVHCVYQGWPCATAEALLDCYVTGWRR